MSMKALCSVQDLQLILYQALGEPIGLLVQTSDFPRARAAFYRARAEAHDPDLDQLQLRASPGLEGGDLIIVNRKVLVGAGPKPIHQPVLSTEAASEPEELGL